MKNDLTYLFFGSSFEYFLHPLYEYMTERGYQTQQVVLLDEPAETSKAKLQALAGRSIILVTSAHLLYDHRNYCKNFIDDSEFIISPLELINWLQPKKCVYYPHDLYMPVLQQEHQWLTFFDLLLVPMLELPNFQSHSLRAYTKVEEVGWVKKSTKQFPPADLSAVPLLLLAEFDIYRRWGVEKFIDIWRPILETGVAVKFPFQPGREAFEQACREMGAKVYPAELNSMEIMLTHPIMISNSCSSTNLEAYLSGLHVLNVLDGIHDASFQKRFFSSMPGVVQLAPADAANWLAAFYQNPWRIDADARRCMAAFDYEKAARLIRAC